MSLFKKLNAINVSMHIEKKGQLNYLSWAWAWTTINQNAEKVKQNIYKNADGLNYHHDGKTAWVEVGIEADGIEHIEMLPIMDFKNKSIPIANLTSMDVNKAIQRAGTKAIARHGLGMYIYAGEDLPSDSDGQPIKEYKTASKQTPQDVKEYKAEFTQICKSVDVDTVDFLTEWLELELDKANDVNNAVAKYLKDKKMFFEQLDNYKSNKAHN